MQNWESFHKLTSLIVNPLLEKRVFLCKLIYGDLFLDQQKLKGTITGT
jgi:hypothetical protein